MEATLHSIEKLLRQYNHDYEANLAGIVKQQAKTNPCAACQLLDSSEWWGVDGSIAAIDLALDVVSSLKRVNMGNN